MGRTKLNFGQSGQSGPGSSVRNGKVSVSGHVRAVSAGAGGRAEGESSDMPVPVLIDAERCTGGGTMVAAAGMSTFLLKMYPETK